MVIKQATPAQLAGAEVVTPNTNREDSILTLAFPVSKWRLIAAACGAVKQTSLIDANGSKTAELRSIAKLIAEQTGKAPE